MKINQPNDLLSSIVNNQPRPGRAQNDVALNSANTAATQPTTPACSTQSVIC